MLLNSWSGEAYVIVKIDVVDPSLTYANIIALTPHLHVAKPPSWHVGTIEAVFCHYFDLI